MHNDESIQAKGFTIGGSIGFSTANFEATKQVAGGFRLRGDGTNWTTSGNMASDLYNLISFTSGRTVLGLPNRNYNSFDAQAIQITYTGTNNYKIERIYSGLGAGFLGFALWDIDLNARVTTPPTTDDYVHLSGYSSYEAALSWNNWIVTNRFSSNEFLADNNFFVIGVFELWLKVFNVSPTSLRPKWQAKAGVTEYRLYRDTNSDFSTETQIYTGTELSYLDEGLTTDTMYYYRLDDQTDTEISRFQNKPV
jgi:hypothetical protein